MKKETISLSVSARDAKETPGAIRRAQGVPGVLYGGKTKNTSVKCNAKDLHSVYVKAGENTIVEVDMGGKKIPCLIHAISFDPVTGQEEHVDLYALDMAKKVTTHVPVVFKGESPAVKALGGVLVTVHSELEVTCLPADLPESFIVDIGILENFHDSVTVAKLQVPAGVTIKNSPETMIVTVQEPRKEEVIEVVAPVAGAEGAPAAEGAAGAAAPGAPGAAPAAGTAAPAAKTDAGKEKAKK